MAAVMTRPEVGAAATVRKLMDPGVSDGFPADLDITSLVAELEAQTNAAASGSPSRQERMLAAQAQTLDALFHTLTRRAATNFGHYPETVETYMRLALRAQSNCRATIETLAEIKNPKPVAFIRQANVAHGPQQVNSRPRARKKRQRTKLLEAKGDESWLDTRAKGAAAGADPQLEAVGEVDRPKVGGWKGHRKP